MTPRLLLAALLLTAAASRGSATDFVVDPGHTSLIFSVSHTNISYTYGRFNAVKGTYTLDENDPTASKFQVVIDAGSIDTNHEQRDTHLKSPDFLNTGEFPVIKFTSTKVAARQEEGATIYEVTGDFEMHGVTKPLTFELKKLGEGEGPFGYRSGFVCQTKLKRSDFGMDKMLEMVGDEISIMLSFEGVRQEPGAEPASTGATKPRLNDKPVEAPTARVASTR